MTLKLSCPCGRTHWIVSAPRSGTRLTCYCADCQTAARHVEADVLDEGGGSDILQVAAHQLSVEGAPLALMRLSPKGLFRWHTSCCNTPVANSLPFPHLSFAGVLLANAQSGQDTLPKTAAVVNTVYAKGRPGVPAKDRGMGRSVIAFFRRSLAARMSGKWRETPFFTGPPWTPVAPPRVLSKEERNAARP
ncbi:DUF6151 family protein [Primorskyibacter sp. S187A]|uniref:DUF6151 family protein n=1 Tax=Primorskyibacter sp. S187A TaxID=3415130 RepID=UPI003C7EB186